jgi:hypothetical protein
MKKKFAAVIGVTAVIAVVSAGPASAAPGKSCVGPEVSALAHLTQEFADTGLGAFAHSSGLNLGQGIQEFNETVCKAG